VSLQKYVTLHLDLDQQPLFLISDLHAGAHSPEIELNTQRNLEILAQIVHQQNGQLIILGDLFDYWHESGNNTPPCLSHWISFFEKLHSSTRKTILLTGNHDHWAHTALSDLGFIIVEDSISLFSNHSEWFLIHGDGLPDPTLKLHRSGFNKIFRDIKVNKLFNLLPFRLRVHLMKSFSHYRRYRMHSDHDHYSDSLYLETWLQNSSYKGLVYGHTHLPEYKEFGHQILVNLGTFYSDIFVLKLQGDFHQFSTLNELIQHYRSTSEV